MPDLTGITELLSRLVGAPIALGFGAFLAVHIAAGLVCVVSGAVALLSLKQQGRHPRFGVVYYRSRRVLFATATVLAALRLSNALSTLRRQRSAPSCAGFHDTS